MHQVLIQLLDKLTMHLRFKETIINVSALSLQNLEEKPM